MPLRGSVATMALEDVLDWADRRKVMGVLSLERGSMARTFAISQGAVVWTTSSRIDEQLGQVLLAGGHIDDAVLSDALTVHDETSVPLGKILIMIGAVDEHTLVRTLKVKFREAVTEVVTWHDGHFDFEPKMVAAQGVDAAVPLEACLDLARRRLVRWTQLREWIPSDDCRFFPRTLGLPADAPGLGELPGGGRRLWELAADGHTAGRIAAAMGGERFAVFDALMQWIAGGLLSIDRRSGPRTDSGPELAAGALARLRQGDRAGALEMAQRALAASPEDPDVRRAHADAERARVAEVARSLLARHRVPRLRRSPAEIETLDLSDLERRLVHRIDGRWDLLSLVRSASVREGEALLALARLAERGVVELS